MAGRTIMLVEGTDDKHVVMHICGNHSIPHLDEIKEHGGIEGVLENFPIELKFASDEVDVVGVVVDADESVASRWQGLHDILRSAGYEDIPDRPNPEGTILFPPTDSVLPRAGVWIMPDNRTDGKLEDFLRLLVPQPSPLFDHAVASVDSVPERRFSENDRIKALIHTWLAWQREPGKPYGTAISAGFLDSGSADAVAFASWIRRLFFG